MQQADQLRGGFGFPDGFLWGTATSSHQVEGDNTNNDWFLFEQEEGRIFGNHQAGKACDWWQNAEADFDRIAEMGQTTHRLSIEWSRVEPSPGVWDEEAINRYREMLKGLIQRGVKPMVTLHHFTNPIWFAEHDGWENDAAVGQFERYTRKVIQALGDLTDLWCTVNEPAVLISQGYGLGRFPPAKEDLNAAFRALLNIIKAHAAAYETIHELQPNAQVGLAKHMVIWQAWRAWMPNDHIVTGFIRHLFNDMVLQMLSQGMMRIPGRRNLLVPKVTNTLDWLGLNYYQRYRLRFALRRTNGFLIDYETDPRRLRGPGEWGEIHPEGIYIHLKRLWKQHGVPLYITENGIPDGKDAHRPRFIVTHLREVHRAIQQEIPIKGYYFWSLLDNFEWSEGYDPQFQFGLYAVDFKTQTRTARDSVQVYADVCQHNGMRAELVQELAPELAPT